jgi:hypothetical protein
MNNVLFISEETLKTYTSINENVQSDELRWCIMMSQQIQLQESLGTNLYNKMIDLVDSGDITLPGNSNYKHLLDEYIQPMLINYSYYMGLDNFYVKFMSVGLVSNRSEQGTQIDFKTFQYLKTNAKQQAEFSDNLLRRHLIFRSGNYPEYNNGDLNSGELPPIPKSPFKANITLPGSSYYAYNRNKNGSCWFCQDSPYPQWYGSPNNSKGVPGV